MTVADALKAAGYTTAMFGKWHIGGKGKFRPGHRGFDEAIVTSGGHYNFKTNPRVEVPEGTYLADFLTDQALRFVEKNKDRPFFLYLPHFAVHVPLQAKPELIDKYKSKPGVDGHNNPVYAAMIASLDESVGRILAKLDELKLADRTVVIFTSDNGGVGGYRAAGIDAGQITDNSPLRAGKGTLYEGGIRVPFLVRWPRMIRPGTVCDEPAIHVDIFPTFVELAGAARPNQPLDGLSLVSIFRDPKGRLGRDALYWHFPGYLQAKGSDWRTTPVGVVRAGDFKLMEFFETARLELYNLKEDLGEKHNLADRMPGKAKELHAKLVAWREALHAAMPRPKNPMTRPSR
jgi:arylsulfatase A-like enzyme